MSTQSRHPYVINEDMPEDQLAEVAFGTEVVVYWGSVRQPIRNRNFGIIVGYEDPATPGGSGSFIIDPVLAPADSDDVENWPETGEPSLRLKRTQFVVFGPANRDPGDRESEGTIDGWGVVPGTGPTSRGQTPNQVATEVLRSIHGIDQRMVPFLCAAIDLIAARQEHFDDLAFHVRLDANVKDGQRRYRLLVRPVEPPIMHGEIEDVLQIASRYELSASHQQVGLEIHRPEEVVES